MTPNAQTIATPVQRRLEDRLQRFVDLSYIFVTTENVLLRAQQVSGRPAERSDLGKRFLALINEHVNDPLDRPRFQPPPMPQTPQVKPCFISHVVDPQDLAQEVDAARAILRDALPAGLDEINPTASALWKIAQAAEEALNILDTAVDAPYAGSLQPSFAFEDL